MPLVRSECLLMTSFTNNKPFNQAGKHTAQQDLYFIPVRQWTEGKKERGGQGGIRKHGDKKQSKREKWRKCWLRERRDGESKVREPKGAMQSNNTNTVSVIAQPCRRK